MAKTRTETEKKPNSLFKKLEIHSLTDIFELYLFFEITQEVGNALTMDCVKFLYEKKNINPDIVTLFSIQIDNHEDEHLTIFGNNLLSSLWIIGVYPEKPEELIDKNEYSNGDFTYKFYTENKNLSIKPTKKNERKSTGNSRNRKVSKRSQRKG